MKQKKIYLIWKTLWRLLWLGLLEICLITSVAASSDGAGKWKSGTQIYTKVCAHCHESGVGPIVLGRKLSPEYIKVVVRNGQKAMPAFRKAEINDSALDLLLEYISKANER